MATVLHVVKKLTSAWAAFQVMELPVKLVTTLLIAASCAAPGPMV